MPRGLLRDGEAPRLALATGELCEQAARPRDRA
jgi:hypothetical protein